MALEPTTVALIGTVFGGVGLKVMEHWLGKSKVRIDHAAVLREEQRQELADLRAENRRLEEDVDKWKLEYYDLRDAKNRTETQLQQLLSEHKINLPPPKDE